MAEQRPKIKIKFLWLLPVAALGAIAIAVVFYVMRAPLQPAVEQGPPAANQAPPLLQATTKADPPEKETPKKETIVEDDGKLLWASPTQGEPISLDYLPAGVQLILHIRLASVLQHAEGEKVLAALGPWGKHITRRFHHWFPGKPSEASTLTLASSPQKDNQLSHVLRIELETAWSTSTLQQRLGDCQKRLQHEQEYFIAEEKSYWLPTERAGEVLVICNPNAMQELIASTAQPATLPRDLQRLLPHTDNLRIFTAAFQVKFLQGSGRELIADGDPSLQKMLAWMLGDDATAAVLSLHWQRDFFMELRAISTLNTRPHHYAAQLGKRMGEIANRVEDYLVARPAEPYGRKVLAQLPGMLRMLQNYTRTGSEQGHAVLRAYLPARAGHNLLLAAELALTQPAARGLASTLTTNQTPTQTIEQKLAMVTSLSFPKETLEQALILLAEDIGVEIELRGRDLQLEGITKNQSFGLDLRGLAARDILVEILRQANPDRTATGPADVLQKLVYIVEHQQGSPGRIVVTTRSAAASRGNKLPEVFRTEAQ